MTTRERRSYQAKRLKTGLRGFAKLKNSKNPKKIGSGWVDPGPIRIKKIGKSSKNKVHVAPQGVHACSILSRIL